MTRRALQIIFVVALIALAGCNGFAASPFEDSSPDREAYGVDEPLDPEEIETETEFDDEATPPGTPNNESGWVDAGQVLRAHSEATRGTTYRQHSRNVLTLENGTTLIDNRASLAADPVAGTFHVSEQFEGQVSTQYPPSHFPFPLDGLTAAEQWVTQSPDYEQVGAFEYANGSTRYHRIRSGFIGYYGAQQSMISFAENVSVERLQDDGDRYYRLHSETPRDSNYLEDEFQFEAYVDSEGVIVYTAIEGTMRFEDMPYAARLDEGELEGQTITVQQVTTTTDINETDLEEPDWVETAREEAPDREDRLERGDAEDEPAEGNGDDAPENSTDD
ncbi:hypothetical protein [Natronosalvus halobius]|uniref:hypothetical protein n=1 Tax=Natronosalvus halobius TaxID=2953746 RepID=UPI0020A01E0D|nr:hypothetical protein [Natronosalvus halobius]USZ71523.1 hypothetical protein NGM15_15895 [Natronosalvus halobius]